MRLVLSHNADDVVGLARLVARAKASSTSRAAFRAFRPGPAGLGRTLLAAGRAGEGEELLEAAAADGRREGRRSPLHALPHGQESRGQRTPRVPAAGTYRCAVERAKTCEHVAGDFVEAARWASEALRLAPRETRSPRRPLADSAARADHRSGRVTGPYCPCGRCASVSPSCPQAPMTPRPRRMRRTATMPAFSRTAMYASIFRGAGSAKGRPGTLFQGDHVDLDVRRPIQAISSRRSRKRS